MYTEFCWHDVDEKAKSIVLSFARKKHRWLRRGFDLVPRFDNLHRWLSSLSYDEKKDLFDGIVGEMHEYEGGFGPVYGQALSVMFTVISRHTDTEHTQEHFSLFLLHLIRCLAHHIGSEVPDLAKPCNCIKHKLGAGKISKYEKRMCDDVLRSFYSYGPFESVQDWIDSLSKGMKYELYNAFYNGSSGVMEGFESISEYFAGPGFDDKNPVFGNILNALKEHYNEEDRSE